MSSSKKMYHSLKSYYLDLIFYLKIIKVNKQAACLPLLLTHWVKNEGYEV